jgi:rhodanese-related sulfurtransferase
MVTIVDPGEAQALIDSGAVEIVDVRGPGEWAGGHLPGARNVPLEDFKAGGLAKLSRDRVLFVCARGVRSVTAAKLAEQLGVGEVYSLAGGTHAWIGAGLPLEK